MLRNDPLQIVHTTYKCERPVDMSDGHTHCLESSSRIFVPILTCCTFLFLEKTQDRIVSHVVYYNLQNVVFTIKSKSEQNFLQNVLSP